METGGQAQRLSAGELTKMLDFLIIRLVVLRYVTAPLNEVYASVARHPHTELHVVSEFRTSKLCPRCHKSLIFPKLPHRYVFCPRCQRTYNRDAAAAENILKNGISQVYRMTEEDFATEAAVSNMSGELSLEKSLNSMKYFIFSFQIAATTSWDV